MRFAIVGVGAVGTYFGCRLTQAGHEVHALARGETLAALQRAGFTLRIEDRIEQAEPASATDNAAAVGPVECVFVAVKTWQLPGLAAALQPLVGPDTAVIPLLNGVEAPAVLAAALGDRPVLGGLCKILAIRQAPAVVRHVGAVPTITFGELDSHRTARVDNIVAALERADIRAEVPASIETAMWEKLLFISPVSGIGAAARATLGQVREVPDTRDLLTAAMREVADVAVARGLRLRDGVLDLALAFVDKLPAAGTSSLHRDLVAGVPSELEAQVGAVVRFGAAAGVPTPIHQTLYAALLPGELAARAAYNTTTEAPQ